MKYVILATMLAFTSCSSIMPGLTQALDDAVTDTAVSVQVDKAAMQKDTDVDIAVKVTNKDPVASPVVQK